MPNLIIQASVFLKILIKTEVFFISETSKVVSKLPVSQCTLARSMIIALVIVVQNQKLHGLISVTLRMNSMPLVSQLTQALLNMLVQQDTFAKIPQV